MRRSLLLALAALAALPVPAPAASRVFPAAAGNAATSPGLVLKSRVVGPFLTGEDTIFVDRDATSLALVADGPGGRRELLTAPDQAAGEDRLNVSLDVADGRAAVATYRVSCNGDADCARYQGEFPQDSVLRTGPVAGPLQTLESCATHFKRLSVTATGLLSTCDNGYELHEDGRPREAFPVGKLGSARLAGDFIGVSEYAGEAGRFVLRVLRRADRSEVYRVEIRDGGFDLAPDGTVVYPLSQPGTFGWSSPADPAVHPITVPRDQRPVSAVVAAGDRFAARLGEDRDARIVVADRAGTIAAEANEPAMTAGIDFDGSRLTWARNPCSRERIVVWDLADPLPDLGGDRCDIPELEFAGAAPLRLPRNRRLSVTISCPSSGRAGCSGGAIFAVRLRRRPGVKSRLRGHKDTSFDLLPGESKTVRIRVRKKGLKRFRTGRVLATISTTRETDEISTRRTLKLR